jgi:SOS-response transcriptional repressor LexA
MKRFGGILRAWRTSKRLSQAALEEASGVGLHMVGYYERGENSPTLETFGRLCDALAVSPSDFFAGPPGYHSEGGDSESRGADRSGPPPGHHAVPAYESLQAGPWSEIVSEEAEEFIVPDWLIPNRSGVIAVRVHGDSMEYRIADGALVFLDTTRHDPRSGEIVAALLDGEATLKVYRVRNREVWLEPWNRNYTPIKVEDTRHLRILGVMIGHWTPTR